MKQFQENKPNPGSYEAREVGCTCPVLDNCRGRGYFGKEGVFVINCDCIVHGGTDEKEEDQISGAV